MRQVHGLERRVVRPAKTSVGAEKSPHNIARMVWAIPTTRSAVVDFAAKIDAINARSWHYPARLKDDLRAISDF